jgi:DNA-directed RNA polymerase subunit beta'
LIRLTEEGTEKDTVLLADAIMQTGYSYATKAGISINVKDMVIPDDKKGIIDASQAEVDAITQEYNEGSITNGERYNKIVDVWAQTNEKLSKVMIDNFQLIPSKVKKGEEKNSSFFQRNLYDGGLWSKGFCGSN